MIAATDPKPATAGASTAGGVHNPNGNKGGTTPAKMCHYGLYNLGHLGKATIWVGREAAVGRNAPNASVDFALVICLIGGGYPSSIHHNEKGTVMGNTAAQALLPSQVFRRAVPIPFLYIDWPDYGVPALDKDWWDSFIVALAEVEGDVALYCMGGHGRTGTAASILAVAAGWVRRGQCPVTWLRKKYCKNVVESNAQLDYIEQMANCKVAIEDAKGDKDWYSYGPADSRKVIPMLKGAAKKAAAAARDPKTLTRNAFKKWAKRQRSRGFHIPQVGELDDGELVEVNGQVFQWSKPDLRFEWCGVAAGAAKDMADAAAAAGSDQPIMDDMLPPSAGPTPDTHCFACQQPFPACKCT